MADEEVKEEMFDVGSNIDGMLENSEVISGDEKKPQEDNETKTEPTDEQIIEEETPQDTDPNEKDEDKDSAKEEKSDDPGLIKVGEIEMTESDWLAAHKDMQNKKKWVDKNTKLGQLYKSKYVTPENIDKVLAYAIGNKPIPEDLEKSLKTQLSKEVEVELEDENGEMVTGKVPLDKILPKNTIESIKKQMVNEYFPEYSEYRDTSQKYSDLKKEYDNNMKIVGSQIVEDFIKDKSHLKITVPENKTLEEQMQATLRAGEDHPEYNNAVALFELMKLAQDSEQPIASVYKAKYSDKIHKQKQADAIKKNQSQPQSEKPGENVVEKSEDEKFMGNLEDPHKKVVNELFS